MFSVEGNWLYRDRGFSANKDAEIMRLRTEYSRNMFEEEIRLIGSQHRTRQTIVARADEEQTIGQYLETRM